jgi:hypothetical protein
MKRSCVFAAPLVFLLLGAQAKPVLAQCPPCGGGPEVVNSHNWTLTFVRPCLTAAITAGGRGGGIEIQNATFNGRLVLFRGHTPILYVKYQNDLCGPYRDWQYEESRFVCSGNVPSPGRCNGAAVTNCANPPGGDVGNFCGVSVDTSNPSYLLLTTVVKAGWYRYQLEWYFFSDGTFIPAIKWTGVPHPCLNNNHIHFAFWRLDFDMETSTPNIVEEFNTAPLASGYFQSPDPLFVEMSRMKDLTPFSRWWRVRNTSTNRGYLIVPPDVLGLPFFADGAAVVPQIADLWLLQYMPDLQSETDDCAGGLCSLGGSGGYWAHLNRFINESSTANMVGADVVTWYAGSHYHQGNPTPPACNELNGPICVPDPGGPPWQ